MKKLMSVIFALTLAMFTSLTVYAVNPPATDAESPSDVENVMPTPLNGAVKLSWDAAHDNVAVTGYQVHYGKNSVGATGQSYESDVDAGNALEYTVAGLTNETKYYFSVIAYDAAANESLRWARETSATPSATLGTPQDTVSPKVSNALALNKTEVKVTFSEEIVLPVMDPQDSFTIEDGDTFADLTVTEAKMDTTDTIKKTVILTTTPQTADASYKLTVGIDIEDKSGNPIISGTSDTAVFTGSGVEKAAPDTTAPEVTKVTVEDSTHVVVEFSEPIVLSIDPSTNFTIVQEFDALKTLEILGVELTANEEGVEDTVATLLTSAQEAQSYIVTVSGLKDEAGNDISETKNTEKFQGIFSGTADMTPPTDPTELLTEYVLKAGRYVVTLMWQLPQDTKTDSKTQTVYMTKTGTETGEGKDYAKTTTLNLTKEKYDVKNLKAGDYWFKLTQKDSAGNESAGVMTKISLAETGPEMLGLVLVSLALGQWICKRKKS